MKWINSNERRPAKAAIYRAKDSKGTDEYFAFYDGYWHSHTGHPVVQWLDPNAV
jgi:hypothetical protein